MGMNGLQVDVSWDAAVACIKSAVESGLDVITNPLPMLYIKDFLLLCCSTLGVHPQPQSSCTSS